MQFSSFALYAVADAFALCFALAAQDSPATKPTSNSSHPRQAAPQVALKLTDRQRQGLKLLRAARAEAAALEPPMRAVVLEQIAGGYAKVSPTRAQHILHSAFLASLDIAEGETWSREECLTSEVCRTKSGLQVGILSALANQSATQVEHLLPRAEPQAQLQVTNWLISKYTEKKNFDRAEELITRMSTEGEFPYPAATQLLQSLPKERSSDRLTLFLQALDNFRTFGNSLPQFGDLGMMLSELWRQLPPPVVLNAIDLMLDQAKEDDEKDKVLVTFHTRRGNPSFSSAYEYRLFQLLPILKEIDPDRAETLLRDHQHLQATLQELPDGLQSLWNNPDPGETVSMGVRRGNFPPVSASDMLDQHLFEALERREEQIRAEADKDPRAALADAATLPLKIDNAPARGSPRADMLSKIAWNAVGSNPSVARDALDELEKVIANLSVGEQGHFLTESGMAYYALRDEQALEKTVKKSLKVAQKLYELDSDPSDPNLALKANWPCANVWWSTIRLAARISPDYASRILAEIPDPEIRTFVKVAFGNSLLGARSMPLSVEDRRRDGWHPLPF